MTIEIFGHPFAAYAQKVFIALKANGTPYTFRMLSPDEPENGATFASLWPIKRMPVLRDGDRIIKESTIILEYLQQRYPGPVHLLPGDADQVLEARLMDRCFDNYIMTPMQRIVGNALRPADDRDPCGVAEAKRQLDTTYAWLESVMATRSWAAGDQFSIGDCAAAPALFYADWVHQIDAKYPHLRAYRAKLLAHPPVKQVVDDGRPYRHFFPLGAPDRD